MLHDQAHEAVPPKGGTLTAVGAASPNVQHNPSPLEFRVYAKNRRPSGPDCGTPAIYACAKGQPAALRANYVSVPILASFDLAPDPDGFSRAAADAVGVGRREALGVRQLAAALFLCENNVSVPLFATLLDVRRWHGACGKSIRLLAHSVAKERRGGRAATLSEAYHARRWRVPVRHYCTECLVGLKRSRITAEISPPPLGHIPAFIQVRFPGLGRIALPAE